MTSYRIEEITSRLAEDAQEVDNALSEFMAYRMKEVERQKRAVDNYDAEMAEIEANDQTLSESVDVEAKASVDHNMMRHLNITKRATDMDDFDGFSRVRDEEEFTRRFEPGYTDEPSKVDFDKGLKPKPPMPTDDEKEAIRDEIFVLLEESKAEEFVLELEYEKLREEVGAFRSEHLAEGLFTIYKENYRKLKGKLEEYQPQGFGKAWGNDPDYIAIMAELKEKLGVDEIMRMEAEANGEKKKKKKKKKGGH
jgi:hypothetical protein